MAINTDSNQNVPPGLKLRREMAGHRWSILKIAWSFDGRWLLTADDLTTRLWDVQTGTLVKGFSTFYQSISWSPDGTNFVTGGFKGEVEIRLCNVPDCTPIQTLAGHAGAVNDVAWSPDGKWIATASADGKVRLWLAKSGNLCDTFSSSGYQATRIVWSPDSLLLASLSPGGGRTFIWAVDRGQVSETLVHPSSMKTITWIPSGELLVTAGADGVIHLWDTKTWNQAGILEAHTAGISHISFSHDGKLLASVSSDETIRIWRGDTWEPVAVLAEPAVMDSDAPIAFSPGGAVFATLGPDRKVIRIWDVDPEILLGGNQGVRVPRYTNAKVVLVGDTGVGKSGLGLVLAGETFGPTDSTHGRRILTLESREIELDDGRQELRETLLWDLAGQPGYRLIHQLHLNEVAVALVVFDARNETDPFAGVRHWERALRQARSTQGSAAPTLKKLLVAARMDRGSLGVSRGRIETIMQELGFDGFFETSAREGWKIQELSAAVREAIDWASLPFVNSTELFQQMKEFLLEEKQAGRLLSTIDDLYRAFLKSAYAPSVSGDLRAQFETCVGRLEARDLIQLLSFGKFVLLQPELLDSYASAIVNAAKDEPDGLGSIAEEDARGARFRISEDERIKDKDQEKLLLIATIEDLLRHEIALREQTEHSALLVFPSQFTRENPDLPDPEGKAVIFKFEGPLLNIYATLAVRLSHSGFFTKKEMWKNAASYSARVGGLCGIFLREIEEGRGELTLFFDEAASEETCFQFEEYVQTHLRRRALPESLERRRIFVCPKCCEAITDKQAQRRRQLGHDTVACPVCETEISMLDREERLTHEVKTAVTQIDQAANSQLAFEVGLTSAAGELRTKGFMDWAASTRVTIALVFTDVVASTPLAIELGNEAMGEARRAHFAQARLLLHQHEGYEIKTIGDSFMVAFRTAVQALNFALKLHRDTGHSRVNVRFGIHVGLVEIDEGDAFGAMVNFTSRIIDQAKKAEIWISERAKTDIDEEKAKAHVRLRWTRHADCELKGFHGKFVLWSVVSQ